MNGRNDNINSFTHIETINSYLLSKFLRRRVMILSLRAFGPFSSSLLLFPQHFGRYVLRPSSGVCQTREPSVVQITIKMKTIVLKTLMIILIHNMHKRCFDKTILKCPNRCSVIRVDTKLKKKVLDGLVQWL